AGGQDGKAGDQRQGGRGDRRSHGGRGSGGRFGGVEAVGVLATVARQPEDAELGGEGDHHAAEQDGDGARPEAESAVDQEQQAGGSARGDHRGEDGQDRGAKP